MTPLTYQPEIFLKIFIGNNIIANNLIKGSKLLTFFYILSTFHCYTYKSKLFDCQYMGDYINKIYNILQMVK